MKLNEIYAIRLWADGQLYWATDYKAKPNYSNECIKINGEWVLSSTREAVPYWYVASNINYNAILIILLIILWVLWSCL